MSVKKPYSTTYMLLANEKFSNQQPKCLYCKKFHWSDECKVVNTLQGRRELMKGKCYVCLKPGHRLPECKSDRPCYHVKVRENIIEVYVQSYLILVQKQPTQHLVSTKKMKKKAISKPQCWQLEKKSSCRQHWLR